MILIKYICNSKCPLKNISILQFQKLIINAQCLSQRADNLGLCIPMYMHLHRRLGKRSLTFKILSNLKSSFHHVLNDLTGKCKKKYDKSTVNLCVHTIQLRGNLKHSYRYLQFNSKCYDEVCLKILQQIQLKSLEIL